LQLPIDKEMRFVADSVETIRRVTGQKAIGWNAYWMRSSIHLLETLQQLGFLSQVDETGRDPLSVRACGSDFMNVPYTFKVNDVLSFPFEGWNAQRTSRRCATSSISFPRKAPTAGA
jgi:hypothetical protein